MDAIAAVPGISPFKHWFGGDDWTIIDPNPVNRGPVLVLCFDLGDMTFRYAGIKDCHLPLPSYVDCGIWNEPQRFIIDWKSKSVRLISRTHHGHLERPNGAGEILNTGGTLPRVALQLIKVSFSADDTVESSIVSCTEDELDTFLGGELFIRVGENLPWVDEVLDFVCSRGHPMYPIAAIGYENLGQGSRVLEQGHFFIGEGALYWGFCPNCKELLVQSTSS